VLHFTLVPDLEVFYLTAHTPSGDRTFPLPKYFDITTLFSRKYFDVVHLHHSMGFELEVIQKGLESHGNFLISIHDYWSVCDGIFLASRAGEICDGLSCQLECWHGRESLERKRSLYKKILEKARVVVHFSQSTKDILERTMSVNLPLQQIPHGVALEERTPVDVPEEPHTQGVLRVLLIGTFVKHKGADLLRQAIAEVSFIEGIRIEWHFVGVAHDMPEVVRNHGVYHADTLQKTFREISPHTAILLPQCQETYSITLDELIWAGIPVIVSSYGALSERVRGWSVGYVVESTIEAIREQLTYVVEHWSEHKQIFYKARETYILTSKEEAQCYHKLYQELYPQTLIAPNALSDFLTPSLSTELFTRFEARTLSTMPEIVEVDPVLESLALT
jgi:glycosyltransferase involved in cell wall biosynthesis